jgi:outer membrane protein OmpA-like peptidoglycan-associated protein
MSRKYRLILTASVATLLGACATTPDKPIEELETARAIVPQVENSPRAGVAATYISEARKSLDRANQLAERGGDVADIKFEASVASKNAQIANEKILAAQAREEIEKGQAERQAVLLEARERQAQAAEAHAKSLEEELAGLNAKKTDRGIVLTLGDVLFDTAKATLKPGAYATIDRLANALKGDSARKVMIEGHTDSVGGEDYNQGLSERRAAAVQAALLERGVPSEQMAAVGKGESTPVASNDNAAGRQQNRRVEMIFQDDRTRVATDTD